MTLIAFVLLLSLSGHGQVSGSPPPCNVFKTVTGDLEGRGTQQQVHYCQRREGEDDGHIVYRNGFVITDSNGTVLGTALTSEPTTWRVHYPSQPLDRLWPVSGGALISLLVMHGARTMDFHVYRFSNRSISEVGTWRGAADISMDRMGKRYRLTVMAGQPDRAQFPDVSVWDGKRFVPVDRRYPDVLYAVGERSARPIISGEPLPPYWLFYNCSIALHAFSAAGNPARGKHVCHLALQRLKARQGISTEIPGENQTYVNSLIKGAQQEIMRLLGSE